MPQRLLELNKTTRHNDFSYKKEFNKKHGINRWDEIHASKVTRKSLALRLLCSSLNSLSYTVNSATFEGT